MSSSVALRQARRLSTAATTTATPSSISISKAKYKVICEHDADKALEIYSSIPDQYAASSSTLYIQDFAVKRLLEANRFTDIENFLESHKRLPHVKQEPFLSNLIRSYGAAGMFHHALTTYNQMEAFGTPRTSLSFNALLSAAVRAKKFDHVPKLFDQMPKRYGFKPDRVSFGMLIKAYCEMGNIELAMETLKEMEGKGVEITSIPYTTILQCLYAKGMFEEADKVWKEMLEKGCADVGAYNVRIMNVRRANVEDIKTLIEEMGNAGFRPDIISYNYLMACYCKRAMLDQAKMVYDDLGKNKCKPNATTFRTLIFYLCKKKRYLTAYRIFKKSVEAHKIPDSDTLKFLVEGLVKGSYCYWEEAEAMIRTIKKKFPPDVVKDWEKVQLELGIVIGDEDDGKKGEVIGDENDSKKGKVRGSRKARVRGSRKARDSKKGEVIGDEDDSKKGKVRGSIKARDSKNGEVIGDEDDSKKGEVRGSIKARDSKNGEVIGNEDDSKKGKVRGSRKARDSKKREVIGDEDDSKKGEV